MESFNGLKTGHEEYDDYLGGLENGHLIVVAARPRIGKSAFALKLLDEFAINRNVPCAYFSGKYSRTDLVGRLMEIRTGLDLYRRNMYDEEYYDMYSYYFKKIAGSPLLIELVAVDIEEISDKCRKFKSQRGISFVVIDYLQLVYTNKMSTGGKRQMSLILSELKELAVELNIPIMVLTQLPRSVENNEYNRPKVEDLKRIIADLSMIDELLLLYRSEYYDRNARDRNIAEMDIVKRNQPGLKRLRFGFDSARGRFDF